MTRQRPPSARVRPDPEGRPAPLRLRRLGWILTALVLAGVAIGWLVRGGGSGGAAPREGTTARDGARRDPGRSGGIFSRGRRMPTAPDVLGALRTAPTSALVRIEGRVLDAISRQPVGGVEIVFASDSGETTAAADAGGAYSINVPTGDYRAFVRGDYVISVGAAPFQRLPIPPDPLTASVPDSALAPMVAVTGPQRGVDLEVQRSGVVTGHVVDGTGRPVAGAVVRAQVGMWRPVMGTDVAESAADGSFRLEVPAGYYDLDAAHRDFAGPALADGARPTVMVYPQMDTSVEVLLARGCIVEGRAIHSNGTPVGAGALERQASTDFFPAGPIAEDGTFRYTTVLEEDVTIRAWPWKSPPTEPQTVRCTEGARQVVSFVVPDRAPDLTGRILDGSGTPQPGAYIDIYGITPGTMNQQERADDAGHWAVFALPAGEYAVTAHVPGKGVASRQVTVPGTGVDLRLSGTGSLTGRADGIADGETFQLTVEGCISAAGSVVMPQTTRVVPVIGGTYRIDGLPACQLLFQARSPRRTQVAQADVTAGGVATANLDLAPPRAKSVRVSVVDAGGAAVAGAQVVVSHLDGAPGLDSVVTDAAGRATVEAHVGDIVHAFAIDPAGLASRSGDYEVSNAAGSSEDAEIEIAQVPTWDP